MYCKYCGSKLNDDSRFCMNCGQAVSTDVNTKYEEKETKNYAVLNNNISNKKNQKSKKSAVIILCVIVLVVATAAVILFHNLSNSPEAIIKKTVNAMENREAYKILEMTYKPLVSKFGSDRLNKHYINLIEELHEDFENDLGTSNYKFKYTLKDGYNGDIEEYKEFIPEEDLYSVEVLEQKFIIEAEANGQTSSYPYNIIFILKNGKYELFLIDD